MKLSRLAYACVMLVSLLPWPQTIPMLNAGSAEFRPFETEATVLVVAETWRQIRLDHKEIKGPGFSMAPMQMTFTVADPALLKGLKPGDHIRFRVSAEDKARIIEIKKLTK